MTDLMKLDLLQPVSLEKAGEKLAVCSRLCWLCFSGQEVVILIVRIELLYDVHEQ